MQDNTKKQIYSPELSNSDNFPLDLETTDGP